MRLAVGLLASLSLVGFAPAFATDPAPQSTTPQGQQPTATPARDSSTTTATPAAAAPTASAPAAASTTTPGTAPASTATITGTKPSDLTPQEKNLISQGYTLQMRKDQKYFCRNEATVGTRFTRKTCQTSDQIFANTQQSKDKTSEIQRGFVTPPPGH